MTTARAAGRRLFGTPPSDHLPCACTARASPPGARKSRLPAIREAAKRRDEICAMIRRRPIGLARQYDVELATGEYVDRAADDWPIIGTCRFRTTGRPDTDKAVSRQDAPRARHRHKDGFCLS